MGWQIMIGLVLGIICGVIFYHNQGAIVVMQSLGTIFIRLIQMIVMPIVVSCLTVGIANIGDIKKLGRIGGKTLIYFEVLTTIALILGITMANVTHPGTFINIHDLHGTDISKYMATAKTAEHNSGFWPLVLSIIPTNIFKSMSDGDMMPVILFSVLFGLGIAAVGEKAKILIDVLNGVAEVMFKVTNFILIAYVTMLIFIIVILGITAHIFHLRYWKTMHVILDEIVLAFTTASSEVTLPRLMRKTHEMGVNKGITSFVIPTGYTFNLDGSAIYQSLAAIFLAQAYGLHLSLAHQVTLLIVLMITSKGMAGVPGASFVVLLASVSTIGVPMAGLTFIAGIDRFVDMGRTAVNVVGNSIATLVIGESEGELNREQYNHYLDNYGKKK